MNLPGGYRRGEQVYWVGPSSTFPSGSSVVHGGHGEVIGLDEDPDWPGVLYVKFPGNQRWVSCCLGDISRDMPAKAASWL